jgi:hypothetical protein
MLRRGQPCSTEERGGSRCRRKAKSGSTSREPIFPPRGIWGKPGDAPATARPMRAPGGCASVERTFFRCSLLPCIASIYAHLSINYTTLKICKILNQQETSRAALSLRLEIGRFLTHIDQFFASEMSN